MNSNLGRKMTRAMAVGGILLAAASFTVPQSAHAQYGQGRYRQDRQDRQGQWDERYERYTYGRINFDWDSNGIRVRDRADLEAQIRRDLNSDAGSRLVGRRGASNGTLDVNVSFRRVNANYVQADVRLGLNQNGRGRSAVTVTESAITQSRDNNIDGQVVLQAFRKARREFAMKVNQFARGNR